MISDEPNISELFTDCDILQPTVWFYLDMPRLLLQSYDDLYFCRKSVGGQYLIYKSGSTISVSKNSTDRVWLRIWWMDFYWCPWQTMTWSITLVSYLTALIFDRHFFGFIMSMACTIRFCSANVRRMGNVFTLFPHLDLYSCTQNKICSALVIFSLKFVLFVSSN